MENKAQRDSWQIQPMPDLTAQLPYSRTFSPEEYERLSCGLIPTAMEDKWFIFLEADRLYLHRSWTGFCIYAVQLQLREGRYVVTEALVNRDPEQYKEINEVSDIANLNLLIDSFLWRRRR